MKLGREAAQSFLDLYNPVSGTAGTQIKVEDLVDKDLIKPFWAQEIGKLTNPHDMIATATHQLEQFYKIHGDKLTTDHYQMILAVPVTDGFLPNNDAKMEYLINITDAAIEPLVKLAESGGIGFLQIMAFSVGETPERFNNFQSTLGSKPVTTTGGNDLDTEGLIGFD